MNDSDLGRMPSLPDFQNKDDLISFITAALGDCDPSVNLLEGSEVLLPSPSLPKPSLSTTSTTPSSEMSAKVARRLSLRTPTPRSPKKALPSASRSRTVSSEGSESKRRKTSAVISASKPCCNHAEEARELQKQLSEATMKNSQLQQEVVDVQLTNKLLLRTIPSVTIRYEEAMAENALLRNVVERLRFHLVNQVASESSGPPSPRILPNIDEVGLLPETPSIFASDDTSFCSLLDFL